MAANQGNPYGFYDSKSKVQVYSRDDIVGVNVKIGTSPYSVTKIVDLPDGFTGANASIIGINIEDGGYVYGPTYVKHVDSSNKFHFEANINRQTNKLIVLAANNTEGGGGAPSWGPVDVTVIITRSMTVHEATSGS